MTNEKIESTIKTLHVVKEVLIAAPADVVFQTVLEPHGPMKEMNMKLEPWPGGRWFRDLGDGNGHHWGHVQAIKRPTLLEISGPLMMSFAAVSNVQYRLKEVDGGTLITLRHTALALFPPDGFRDAVGHGWTMMLDRIRRRVEKA